MLPLTATPTNKLPDITLSDGRECRFWWCDRLALCEGEGDGLALLRMGDGEMDAWLPAKVAPLGGSVELTWCGSGSTNMPTQPAVRATDAPIPASTDRFTFRQSPGGMTLRTRRNARSSDAPTLRESTSIHRIAATKALAVMTRGASKCYRIHAAGIIRKD